MITFVFGHSGCGKSDYVAQCIRDDAARGQDAILIVPEQETLTRERAMASILPPSAPLTFEVTNFTRFINTEMVVGCYNATSGEFMINPNFEEKLSPETEKMLNQVNKSLDSVIKMEKEFTAPFKGNAGKKSE